MKSIVAEKSYAFAVKVVNAYKILSVVKKEYVLSKQFLRSGTATGAIVKEGEHAQSKADFLNKMNVALNEASETAYWLMLLHDTNYLSREEFDSLNHDGEELVRLLASIVKTTKSSLRKK